MLLRKYPGIDKMANIHGTPTSKMNWQVYIVICSDNTLYTGITTDVERRLGQHQSGRGAKYFRGRQPVQLVYLESGHNRSTAIRKEAGIKKMQRSKKCLLISSKTNEITSPDPARYRQDRLP
jgi:putative endonuclease